MGGGHQRGRGEHLVGGKEDGLHDHEVEPVHREECDTLLVGHGVLPPLPLFLLAIPIPAPHGRPKRELLTRPALHGSSEGGVGVEDLGVGVHQRREVPEEDVRGLEEVEERVPLLPRGQAREEVPPPPRPCTAP